MKRNFATWILMVMALCSFGQTTYTPPIPQPLPCLYYNSLTFPHNVSDIVSPNCIELQAFPWDMNIKGDLTGNQTKVIQAGNNVNLKIATGPLPPFSTKVNIQPSPNPINIRLDYNDIRVAWFYPESTVGAVRRYEKLELGLSFDNIIMEQIDNFIEETGQNNSLNPFNPEDIDIKAEFTYGTNLYTVFGFYYDEFNRIYNSIDNSWEYEKINNEYRFRVRFAPPEIGLWSCKIIANINGHGVIESDVFTFDCTSSANKGYVKLGSNKRFLKLDQDIYFPSTRNIPHPTCRSNYQYYDCQSDNIWDEQRKKGNQYLNYLKEISDYADQGGREFRMLLFGDTYEIEFEKLNNYYDRQFSAWELDRLWDLCADKNLFIHFSLQDFAAFQLRGDYTQKWDWPSSSSYNSLQGYNPDGCYANPTDLGYCYSNDPIYGVNTPEEFLTDPFCQKFYKYRLRYITSRWLYSTNVSIVELVGEINNHSKRNKSVLANGGCHAELYYNNYRADNSSFLQKIADWQNTMCHYLKSHQYFPHLTAVNYAGSPSALKFNNLSAIQNGDISFYSPHIDIATYNIYDNFWELYNKMILNTYDLQLPYIFGGHQINKPIIICETGTKIDGYNDDGCDQDISFIKNLWCSSFTGIAGMAKPWIRQHEHHLITHGNNITAFLSGIDLDNSEGFSWTSQRVYTNQFKYVEAYCLVSNESKKRAIGIVNNLTVNEYSIGFNNCGIISSKGPISEHRIPLYISPQNGNKRLRIKNMGTKKYTIDWYNVVNMQYITSSTKWSTGGNLTLEYPELSNGMHGPNGPLIAFKIRQSSEPSFLNQNEQIIENKNQNLPDIFLESSNISGYLDFEYTLHPNPVQNTLNIALKKNSNLPIKVSILNSTGSIVSQLIIRNDNTEIDVSNYSSGLYLILFEHSKGIFSEKFIKL